MQSGARAEGSESERSSSESRRVKEIQRVVFGGLRLFRVEMRLGRSDRVGCDSPVETEPHAGGWRLPSYAGSGYFSPHGRNVDIPHSFLHTSIIPQFAVVRLTLVNDFEIAGKFRDRPNQSHWRTKLCNHDCRRTGLCFQRALARLPAADSNAPHIHHFQTNIEEPDSIWLNVCISEPYMSASSPTFVVMIHIQVLNLPTASSRRLLVSVISCRFIQFDKLDHGYLSLQTHGRNS